MLGALPPFASEPHKDARAPQNLIPTGALEQAMGRALGDARLVERRIRAHIVAEMGPLVAGVTGVAGVA